MLDRDVPAWWTALGLPGLIDIHTHFLPDAVMNAVWAYFDDALDQPVETRHADLPLAILSAYLDAHRFSASSRRTSVPLVPRDANAFYTPLCCDNFA